MSRRVSKAEAKSRLKPRIDPSIPSSSPSSKSVYSWPTTMSPPLGIVWSIVWNRSIDLTLIYLLIYLFFKYNEPRKSDLEPKADHWSKGRNGQPDSPSSRTNGTIDSLECRQLRRIHYCPRSRGGHSSRAALSTIVRAVLARSLLGKRTQQQV